MSEHEPKLGNLLESKEYEGQKWEYCVLGWNPKTGSRVIYFLDSSTEKGYREEVLYKKGSVEDPVVGPKEWPIVAKLGDECWELTHATDYGWLFFKRPKI